MSASQSVQYNKVSVITRPVISRPGCRIVITSYLCHTSAVSGSTAVSNGIFSSAEMMTWIKVYLPSLIFMLLSRICSNAEISGAAVYLLTPRRYASPTIANGMPIIVETPRTRGAPRPSDCSASRNARAVLLRDQRLRASDSFERGEHQRGIMSPARHSRCNIPQRHISSQEGREGVYRRDEYGQPLPITARCYNILVCDN